MIILTLRTDRPEAEIGLYDGESQISYVTWEAHRKLAETIHQQIETLLKEAGKTWRDVDGVVGFQGPGSFTGLRIGLSVENAVGYSLQAPVVAAQGDDWIKVGIERLMAGERDEVALPFYGRDANITTPRK
jgi:tRNA threonylcarbamoyladenosine biosynthesis protein TsaB